MIYFYTIIYGFDLILFDLICFDRALAKLLLLKTFEKQKIVFPKYIQNILNNNKYTETFIKLKELETIVPTPMKPVSFIYLYLYDFLRMVCKYIFL